MAPVAHPDTSIAADVAAKVAEVLHEHDLAGKPVGVDLTEMPVLAALWAPGIETVDGQQVFLEAHGTPTADEISG